MYCPTAMGSEYLAQRNLARHIFGWVSRFAAPALPPDPAWSADAPPLPDAQRDICITFLFVLSSYSLVFLLMKLRSKKTKSASVSPASL